MKVYNKTRNDNYVSDKITSFLNEKRKIKNLIPEIYIKQKTKIINNYFREYNLDTAIVALSGGIDSTFVFRLLIESKKQIDSPIKNIIGLSIPATNNPGVTNQNESVEIVKNISKSFDVDVKIIDIGKYANTIINDMNNIFETKADDWSQGQFIPYLRTAILYYITALKTSTGNRSILVGTTNADEGQYLGYIGKASDGMVDIQPISDIHKSEIYLLSEYLNIDKCFTSVVPKGDMYDSRSDEEVFGASYDEVEFYYYFLKSTVFEQNKLLKSFNKKDYNHFNHIKHNLDKMHKYNMHKYLGCSPAVHLDIFDMKINDGWKYNTWNN